MYKWDKTIALKQEIEGRMCSREASGFRTKPRNNLIRHLIISLISLFGFHGLWGW